MLTAARCFSYVQKLLLIISQGRRFLDLAIGLPSADDPQIAKVARAALASQSSLVVLALGKLEQMC